MTKQAVSNIPESKIKTVKELKELISKSKTILIASIKNIPGSQFQEISKKLRGKAIVKVPKKNLIKRAFVESAKKKTVEISDKLEDSFALLFSELDAYELASELLKNQTPAKAKVGQIAPREIEVEAGPTELVPGPAISELGALGIQIQIKGGKIEIKEPKVIVKEGAAISQSAADIMGKLDIKPFSIGFSPICAYDSVDDVVYLEIKIDEEGTLASLLEAYRKALPFALEIGYVTQDTVKLMIQRAGAYEKRLIRIINGEPEEVIEEVKESTPEPKKEEPKVDAAAGLGALFG